MSHIAARNGVDLPERLLGTDGRFRYTDFLDFLRTYDLAASVMRTGQHYRDITHSYLCQCAAGGAISVELTASPDHAALVGLSDEEHLEGIARGIDDTRRDAGIEGRILTSAVRNFGVEQALRVARYAAERPHPRTSWASRGLAMKPGSPRTTLSRRSGSPPAPVWAARSTPASGPGSNLCGRPWSSLLLASPTVFDRSRTLRSSPSWPSAGSWLECCPPSNVMLGVYPSYEAHPLPTLRAAGVRITLGSDDPSYFSATIEGEYTVCSASFGLGEEELRDITRTALDAAFCDEDLKGALRARLDD